MVCCTLTVAHNDNNIQYIWKYGNNQSIVLNDDVKLSQFDIISYSHRNQTVELGDCKYTLYIYYTLNIQP